MISWSRAFFHHILQRWAARWRMTLNRRGA